MYLYFAVTEFVDISNSFYKFIFYQKIDDAFAYTVDVHAMLADEMDDLLFHFLRTMRIGAVVMDIDIRDRFMAWRAGFRRINLSFLSTSSVSDDAYDVWNHFSTSL